VRGLLDRINSVVSNNAGLWDVFGTYYLGVGNFQQAIEYRQRQMRALQSSGWESNASQFKALVAAAEKLGEVVIQSKDQNSIYSCKLAIRSLIKKSEESYQSSPEYELLKSLLTKLEAAENSNA